MGGDGCYRQVGFNDQDGRGAGAVLFVRAKSELDVTELEGRILERRQQFLEVPGLP
jgi:hypothetical protein